MAKLSKVSPLSIPRRVIRELQTTPECSVEQPYKVYTIIQCKYGSAGHQVLQAWADGLDEDKDDPLVSLLPVPALAPALANEIMSVFAHYAPLRAAHSAGFALPAPLAPAPLVVAIHHSKIALTASLQALRHVPAATYPNLAAAVAAGGPLCTVQLVYKNTSVSLQL